MAFLESSDSNQEPIEAADYHGWIANGRPVAVAKGASDEVPGDTSDNLYALLKASVKNLSTLVEKDIEPLVSPLAGFAVTIVGRFSSDH